MADEYYLKHPREQTFYKIIAPVMGILCLNSQYWGWWILPKHKLFRLQRIMVPIFVPVACMSQILYIVLNYKHHDFTRLAAICTIIIVALVVCSKVCNAQTPSYKKAYTDFMLKIHLYNYYIDNDNEHKKKVIENNLKEAERSIRYTFCLMSCALYTCVSAWVTVPIMHNFQNNHSIQNITTRLELTVYLWQPFDYEFRFYAYLILAILGLYCGIITVFVIGTFDTMNLAFVYHLVGHIKILKYNLEMGQNEKLNDQQWKKKLVDITDTYQFITQTFKDVEAAFGFNVATIYAQNLIQGGLLLYQLSASGLNTEKILTYGLMIVIFMGMLMFISLVLENVRIQAEDIPSLVYDLPWESMSVPNQMILKSILLQVQPVLEFKAAFNIKTGVQPAMNIIKTTFSYYVMIKSTNEM